MSSVNTKILDSTVDRAAMLRLYEQQLTRETAAIAAEHNDRVKQIIVNGKKIPLLLEQEALRYAREGFLHSKKNFLRLAADQLSYTYQSMEAAIGSLWRTQKPRIVAAELVLERPIFSEKTLEGFWGDLSLANKQRIEQAIRNGIAEGLTMEKIALQVRGLGKMTMNQSKAITITAMTSVVAQADREVYRANRKALRGYQYVAVLDSRTTDVCAARDGHIYDIEDTMHLPPAHYRCRSKTVPVFKSWQDLAQLEGAAEVRTRNLEKLTEEQKAYYDGMTPMRESYSDWLRRQPLLIQRKHLGDKADLFNRGQLPLSKFIGEGRELSLAQLRASGYQLDGDTVKFARAKQRLDELKLPYATPDDITDVDALAEYFTLQAGDLDGNLSLTNYRGIQPHVKKATKRRVIETPPREDQVRFNPVSGRYEDSRFYQPNFAVHANVRRLVEELPEKDRNLLFQLDRKLEQRMSLNERTVVMDNMRNLIGRYRKNPQAWGNFKALSNSQMKFDLMNISDSIESQLRSGVDPLKKLLDANYIDPVLGRIQLQELHDTFASNIIAKNKWEDTVAPKIAKELRTVFDRHLLVRHPIIWKRLDEKKMRQFYLRLANRLALADTPDLDALSVQLGRELYQQAAINGDRYKWYSLGKSILEAPGAKKFYKLETFGVQKRRMRSRMSGQYFGPYYDTQVWNIQITDKRIRDYSQLTRKVDLGLRVAVTDEKSRLWFRPGYKTYFLKTKLGYYDTRIPITSTSSFSDFPTALVDKPLTDALNWAAGAKYRVDGDFYDFIEKLLYFEDDKGKAKYYNELNEFRHFFASRSDTYERMKAAEWLRKGNKSFSNHPFVDHRVRIYDRGLVSPQGGETWRPFLSTEKDFAFSKDAFDNLQDQIGSFLGGASEVLEGRHDSLTIVGRQKIAEQWRPELIKIGNAMLRKKPADIRFILEHKLVQEIEGEELAKLYRLALESAKIDAYLQKSVLEQGLVAHKVTFVKGIPDPKVLAEAKADSQIGSYLLHPDLYKTAYIDDKPVGVVRIDNSAKISKVGSIFIRNEYRGRGYASSIIKTAVTPNKELMAFVEPSNKSSQTLFKSLGFTVKETRKIQGDTYDIFVRSAFQKDNTDAYSAANLERLSGYKTALALEQDASSSGAQIIALTTKNKELAELSNVVPTLRKKRLYDEIAQLTYDDPRFKAINERLGLSLKDLQKGAKAGNMVSFYGAGERTQALNVEGKLAKALGKQDGTLVVKARDRDTVLGEISAQAAKYKRFAPDVADELQLLRKQVKDVFDKGLDPGDALMEELWFLSPESRTLVERMSRQYDKVVTPNDFKAIAKIMSEHLGNEVPILKSFTRFYGRLAEDYLLTAKPKNADFDWKAIGRYYLFGGKRSKELRIPSLLAKQLGIKPGTKVKEELFKRLGWLPESGTLHDIVFGVSDSQTRRMGGKYLKLEIAQLKTLFEVKLFHANKLPKRWTNVPSVNFDGKVIEQNFTQVFEEKLVYKDAFGNWQTNIIQVPQRSSATWWEQVIGADGKMQDIADASAARTAFGVNANHSNDAIIVKRLHLWGRDNNVSTSTIHDAFFTSASEMLRTRDALRNIYAETLSSNPLLQTLAEMRARGLPEELYQQYLTEAIETGLIPVPGRSRVGGRLLTEEDILRKEDILKKVPPGFKSNLGWYGVG